ncbi:hypothetical protein Bra3105_00705 [Brachybacterium halotolerans subsp. kimchii]|uniref:hypothetical protein n=1 Tax=Brachybacterium halotolerans TaxID=2795215 RepID=UPI001E313A9C|nr:hypothetical protein [Brachybacterium halotolerans]UEJ82886.1 hypothetical protein Bra3105_00705 [Brachybacterium halotolerans subsp. kimchii]
MVLGLVGLLIGRLGETTWAPETERTATVDLSDPGPAVVIDPGVLYVGGTQGDVKITADSDVSVITASNDDIDAYLDGVKHTQVTGLSDWSTLKTETVDGDDDSISDPTSSDLWRSVKTSKNPTTIDIADFYAEETSTDPQPYRAILLVTDGSKPGADSISITWPVDEKNEWVPFAYAAGATLIIVGLVMLVVSFGSSRRERERVGAGDDSEELGADDAPASDLDPASASASALASSSAGAAHLAGDAEETPEDDGPPAVDETLAADWAPVADEAPTHEHESVDAWQVGEEQAQAAPSAEPSTDALDRVDEEPGTADAGPAEQEPVGPEAPAADESATTELEPAEPATTELEPAEPSTDEPPTEQLSAQGEQRPVTAPIPVGGADGTGAGHDDAEGSEDPTEVIDRIEEPIAGPGEDASAALPRRSHRHRAATPEPEHGGGSQEDAQHTGPEHGSDTEEEQR